jgi:hypothetical protein
VGIVPTMAGTSHAMVPPGTVEVSRDESQHHLSGNTWYQPAHEANGVDYLEAPRPRTSLRSSVKILLPT